MFRCVRCKKVSRPRERPVMLITDYKHRINMTPFGPVTLKGMNIAKEERVCQPCADIFHTEATKGAV